VSGDRPPLHGLWVGGGVPNTPPTPRGWVSGAWHPVCPVGCEGWWVSSAWVPSVPSGTPWDLGVPCAPWDVMGGRCLVPRSPTCPVGRGGSPVSPYTPWDVMGG